MFRNTEEFMDLYTELMGNMKEENKSYCELINSKEYRLGRQINQFVKTFKLLRLKELYNKIDLTYRANLLRKKDINIDTEYKIINSNYFSDERVAVYTCIFGDYDKVLEPLCIPNNCDFYIITDNEIICNSKWSKIDTSKFENILTGYSSNEKNRFFKMNPHLIFDKYKYSIYIDGNIKVITDLTEYIHLVPRCGLAMHKHSRRSCVYKEAKACVLTKKETKDNVKKQINYLINNGMPKNYGLLECNVIVREHNNPLCIKLMEEWWSEYGNNTKRDQLSIPYILYKNGILIEEIAVLGANVFKNYSFRIVKHS